MSEKYAVIHREGSIFAYETRYKLERIIDENIHTYEEYFCCNGNNQTCYYQGTLEQCKKFVIDQDLDVQECLEIVQI